MLSDVDGVWTDGGMYYAESGDEMKRFNTSDSVGVLFCRLAGLECGLVTGETTRLLERRALKLGITVVRQGAGDKLGAIESLCSELGVSMDEVAYIGDDVRDVAALRAVAFSGCPADAPSYVRQYVHYVCPIRGGDGAFRAFVEELLRRTGRFGDVLAALGITER